MYTDETLRLNGGHGLHISDIYINIHVDIYIMYTFTYTHTYTYIHACMQTAFVFTDEMLSNELALDYIWTTYAYK